MSVPPTSGVDTDVLIVGAGPTGLMLANQLVRQGVRTRIIERHSGPARETRALGVQARTLEIYGHLGIAERAIELGKRSLAASMWANGKLAARAPFGDIGKNQSPYPFILILGQDDNEMILGESLRSRGLGVEWNTELLDLSQESDRVRVSVKGPDGTSTQMTAAWVAGCDGARSTVREKNGIAFVGAPYEHVFFVADTQATGSMTPDELNVYLWPQGFHLFFPLRGSDHWRLVGILPADLRGRDGLTFEEVVPAIRREAGPDLTFQKCTWFSTYRIAHRRAERFRAGRCFVLGDAAHVHSPVGAQGMNTGLQDAYNLGWKLALVVAGAADPALLDTYAEERVPVAETLLATTDRLFAFVVSDSRLVGILRTWFLPRGIDLAMHFERLRQLFFRTISQTGIAYRESRLSVNLDGLPADAPRAGDRFPWLRVPGSPDAAAEGLFGKLDDTRFTLLTVGQPGPAGAPTALGDRMNAYALAGDGSDPELVRARIPSPSFYLLRPDGHIAICGGRLEPEAVARYLDRALGARSATDTPRTT